MFKHILMGQVSRFALLMGILLLAFSTATSVMAVVSPGIGQFSDVLLNYARMSMGIADYKDLYDRRFDHYMLLPLYAAFLIFLNILVLNLLIAAMTDAYVSLDKKRTLLCKEARVRDALFLEKALPLPLRSYLLVPSQHQVLRVRLPDGSLWEYQVFLMSVNPVRAA